MKKLTFLVAALCATMAVSAATTVTKTVDELVAANKWTISSGSNATCYKNFSLDEVITVSTSGADNCGSVWGSSNSDWRLYQAQKGDVTITAEKGYRIQSVTLTYNIAKTGALFNGSAQCTSGTAITVNASSITLTVGNTGTAKNGQVKITQFQVVYVEDVDIPATAIALDPTSITKEQYKSATLAATLTPANATTIVEWSSSDEKVATVSNGVVTMVGVGKATITAKAGEGVTATCDVEVSEATVLTCAQAAEKALAVSANNEVAADGKYVIRGYVIKEAGKGIATDFESYGNYSFWMADDKSATEGTFEAFQVKPKDGATIVEVGDFVEIVGDLTKYNTTAETVKGGTATVELIQKGSTTALENVEMSNIYANNGRIYGAEQGRIYTINGMDVTEQNGQLSNGIYIVKVGATATKIAVK